MSLQQIVENFREAMQQHGYPYTGDLVADGNVQRFDLPGERDGKKSGWYVIKNVSTDPSGVYGDWKSGIKHAWEGPKPVRPLSKALSRKIHRNKVQQEVQEREAAQAYAAFNALRKWNRGVAVKDNAYLKVKGVGAHGIKQNTANTLLVPVTHADKLLSIQYIDPDGGKMFMKGGKMTGGYHLLGDVQGELYIAEGYATAATLYEQLHMPVAVAFNAGNLKHVAKYFHQHFKDLQITIAADNDQWTEGNPGLTKAKAAARLVGAKVIFPEFNGLDVTSNPTDFNDYYVLGGSW